MPDGSLALIASLQIRRPHLGAKRAQMMDEQPMPLRALDRVAEVMLQLEGCRVTVEGSLRRRYYSRDGQQHWGQVEIWMDTCTPQTLNSSGEEQ